MSGIVFQVRERSRGNVTKPMVLWAAIMAVVLFMLESHVGPQGRAAWLGVSASVFLGLYLGWQRRLGAILVAPLVSWLFAWFPLVIASMIHNGIGKGFFVALFLVTFGWIGIGLLELFGLGAVAFAVSLVRGSAPPSEPDVVIFGPDHPRDS